MMWLIAMLMGCDGGDAQYTASTPEEALRATFEHLDNSPLSSAPRHIRYLNREEILETLVVAELLEEGEFALVLYRYSIGSTVCRSSMSFMKVGDVWSIFPLEAADLDLDPFREHQDFISASNDKVDEWMREEQPGCWWSSAAADRIWLLF